MTVFPFAFLTSQYSSRSNHSGCYTIMNYLEHPLLCASSRNWICAAGIRWICIVGPLSWALLIFQYLPSWSLRLGRHYRYRLLNSQDYTYCNWQTSPPRQVGDAIEEKTSESQHLEHSFVWCWSVGTAEIRRVIPWEAWNVFLEKGGEDQLDRSCEKWRSVTESQGGEDYPTYNKMKEA